MKRMMFALALAGVTAGASGCGCCRCLYPQQVVPVAAAPACPPPAYADPCSTPPVTYAPPAAAAYPGTPVYSAPQW